MNCKYLSWKFSQLNCKNSSTRNFDLLSNCKQNLMDLICDAWRRNFNLFERFENQTVQAQSKRGWISALHKSLLKGRVKKRFCLCRNFRREFTFSITFKAIDSLDRLWSKIHPRYFTFSYCLIAVPLHTMFKVLAFRSLCLVPNKIGFVFSWPKCTLNLLSTNQSHKLEKSLSGCFSISVTFLYWKTMQVSSA